MSEGSHPQHIGELFKGWGARAGIPTPENSILKYGNVSDFPLLKNQQLIPIHVALNWPLEPMQLLPDSLVKECCSPLYPLICLLSHCFSYQPVLWLAMHGFLWVFYLEQHLGPGNAIIPQEESHGTAVVLWCHKPAWGCFPTTSTSYKSNYGIVWLQNTCYIYKIYDNNDSTIIFRCWFSIFY